MRILLLFFLPLLTSCEWNGVIELEAESDSDSSETTDTGTTGDLSTDTAPLDSEIASDSDFAEDTNHPDTGWDGTDPFFNDLVVVPIVLPPGLQGPPGNLCGFFFSGGGGPDFNTDVKHCILGPPVTGQHTTSLVLPRFDLTGARNVAVVLYVEGGAPAGSPPVPGLDYFGQTNVPVQLFEGMGVVQSEPVILDH